jgi:hypothetical protein
LFERQAGFQQAGELAREQRELDLGQALAEAVRASTWAAMASTVSGVNPCRRRSARAARGLSAFRTPLRLTPPASTAS